MSNAENSDSDPREKSIAPSPPVPHQQQEMMMERERLLFRKIPMALSLMERAMVKRRSQLAAPNSRYSQRRPDFQASTSLGSSPPVPSYYDSRNHATHTSKNNNNASVDSEPLYSPALLEDVMRGLHDCEAERRWYFKAEMEKLHVTNAKLYRSLRELDTRLRRSQREREKMREKMILKKINRGNNSPPAGMRVAPPPPPSSSSYSPSSSSSSAIEGDIAMLQEKRARLAQRLEENETDRQLLRDSLVARPFLSARLWGFLCREDVWVAWMRSRAFVKSTPTDSILFSPSGPRSTDSSASLPLVRLVWWWSRLVLGVLHDVLGPYHQPLSTISPRFVVSLPSRRRRYRDRGRDEREAPRRCQRGGESSSLSKEEEGVAVPDRIPKGQAPSGFVSSASQPASTSTSPLQGEGRVARSHFPPSPRPRPRPRQISLQWMPAASKRLLPLLVQTLGVWRLLLAEVDVRSVLQMGKRGYDATSAKAATTTALPPEHSHPATLLASLLVTVQEVATTTLLLHQNKSSEAAGEKNEGKNHRMERIDRVVHMNEARTRVGNLDVSVESSEEDPSNHRTIVENNNNNSSNSAATVLPSGGNREEERPPSSFLNPLSADGRGTPAAAAAAAQPEEEEHEGDTVLLSMMAMPTNDDIKSTTNSHSASTVLSHQALQEGEEKHAVKQDYGQRGMGSATRPTTINTSPRVLTPPSTDTNEDTDASSSPSHSVFHTVLQELQAVLLHQVGEVRHVLHDPSPSTTVEERKSFTFQGGGDKPRGEQQDGDRSVRAAADAIVGWVSLPPPASAQLLLCLHQLHALSPSSPAARSIVLNGILDLFPQLRTNTWQALLSKARQTSLLAFITRSQHAQLRRHSKRPQSLLESPRQRARLEQRRLAAALREARLTEIQRRTLLALAEALTPTELITLLQLFTSHLVEEEEEEEVVAPFRGPHSPAPVDYDRFVHHQNRHTRSGTRSKRGKPSLWRSAEGNNSASPLAQHRTLMASLLLAETVLVSDVLLQCSPQASTDEFGHGGVSQERRQDGASLQDLANLWVTLTVLRPLVLHRRFGEAEVSSQSRYRRTSSVTTFSATFSSENQLLQMITGQVLHALQDHMTPEGPGSRDTLCTPALIIVLHKVSLGIKQYMEHAPVDVSGVVSSSTHTGRVAVSIARSGWLQQPVHRDILHVATLVKELIIAHKDYLHREIRRRAWSVDSTEKFRNSVIEALAPLGLSDAVLERTLEECTA